MIESTRLNRIFRELRQNPTSAICRMSTNRWSWAGCCNADSLAFTDREIDELFTGGMIEKIAPPAYGWGTTYRFNSEYCPPAYLAEFRSPPCWMDDRSLAMWPQP